MKYTNRMKTNGEIATLDLNSGAYKFYCDTDIKVYEYDTENGKRYAYTMAGETTKNLTFEELETIFETFETVF